MIRAVANKALDLTDEEFQYYNELKDSFGEDDMLSLFKTNKRGEIVTVTPNVSSPTNVSLVFFFLNVMLNQRLRRVELTLNQIQRHEERISKLEGILNDKIS